VPSDSPDDFATLTDLRKKPEFYKIDPKWVSIDPIPVLTTPTYGELTAPRLVEKLKIQSQKDVKQLAEAKEIAYKEGFYSGVMLVGKFSGLPVQEAKPKVRASMIEQGLAFAYAEPENLVISRSADECVVALMDQWYMDYGETEWRGQAERLVFFLSFSSSLAYLRLVCLGCWQRWKLGRSRLVICLKPPWHG
jgi:leucyl-tRNA synthetase